MQLIRTMTVTSPDKRNSNGLTNTGGKRAIPNSSLVNGNMAGNGGGGEASTQQAIEANLVTLGPLGAMNNQATRAGIIRTHDNSLYNDEANTPIVVMEQTKGEGI